MRPAMAGKRSRFSVSDRFDIVVVGAGPVGLLGALAFARAGRSVCLVGPLPQGRDGRTAALLAPSIALLEDLGLWPMLAAEAAPLRRLRIVDDSGSLFRPPPVEFAPDELGLDAFGWNIENARLAEVLAEAVKAEGIAWRPVMAADLGEGEAAHVRLADGSTIAADLVVAADGRRSRIRDAAGIDVSETRYPQVAVTAILRHTREHGSVSTEFHKRGGPLTLVPMPERDGSQRRSSLVWVTSPHHAKRLGALDDAAFAEAVAAASHRLLGDMAPGGPRGAVPLAAMRAKRFYGPRLALAGEAAHVLPPIGAQGLNLGFSDIAALRALLAEGGDPGSPTHLSRYDRARRCDAGLRAFAVDRLNRALLSSSPLLDAVRGVGLGLLGHIPPLRRAVMQAGLPSRG